MQAAKLPASAGWRWISKGLMIFLYKPMPIFTWAMTLAMALVLATLAAPIGPLVFVVCLPTITFLTFMLCRFSISQRPVAPGAWLHVLRRKGLLARLLAMGVCYAGASLLVGVAVFRPWLADLPEAVVAAALMPSGGQAPDLAPLLSALRTPIIVFAIANLAIAACFWYAPVLTGYCGVRIPKALFFSAIACWRNKTAFLVYGLMWAAVFWSIDSISSLLLALGAPPAALLMLQIPVHVVVASVLYCSLLPSFVDVFDDESETSAKAELLPR